MNTHDLLIEPLELGFSLGHIREVLQFGVETSWGRHRHVTFKMGETRLGSRKSEAKP
jgi:hypothetical protein